MHTALIEYPFTLVEIVPSRSWTLFRACNGLVPEAIIHAINKHYPIMETADVIWELSAAFPVVLKNSDVEAIMDAATAHAGKRGDARTVFVCSSPTASEAIVSYLKIAGKAAMTVDYAVFATLEEAERWLTCNRKHSCGSGSHEPGSALCPRGACRSLRLLQSYNRFKGVA